MILAVFVHDILGSSADQREKLVVAEPGTVDAYMQRIIKFRHKVRVVARLQRQVVLAGVRQLQHMNGSIQMEISLEPEGQTEPHLTQGQCLLTLKMCLSRNVMECALSSSAPVKYRYDVRGS